MRSLLLIVFITITGILNAQTFTQTFTICSTTFNAKCEIVPGNRLRTEITNGLNANATVPFDTIFTDDIDVFALNFQNLFKQLNIAACSAQDNDAIVSIGRKFYLGFRASLADSATPVAGVFSIKKEITLRRKDINRSTKTISGAEATTYKIDKVQVEINNGYIENIKAYVNIDDVIHYFISAIPIGVSSVGNFKKYNKLQIFEMYSEPFFRLNCKKCDSTQFYFYLGDLIDYDYQYGVDRRDYSPQDTSFTISGGQAIILHKQKTNKLFEAHIYTDFIGLNEEKPNGLIQTEVSKRININSVQHLIKWPVIYSVVKSVGIFQYISPSLTYSKIEQHNKRLLLGDLDSIRFKPGFVDTSTFKKAYHRYVTAIDLYQYQSFSAGAELNFFYLSNHDLKYTLYINVGGRFGITPVADSLTNIHNDTITKTGYVNEMNVNTLQFYPEFKLTFLPEERFNFSITDRIIYVKPVNPVIQELSFQKIDNSRLTAKTDRWINSIELLMTIQTNANSKLFGRIRFNSAMRNSNNNFAQVQVGYSTYILGK